jgi:hypothetical protein
MCEPFSAVAAGLGVASSILGTVGSVNASRYQAAAADQAARAAMQEASFEASRQAIGTGRLLAQQRAAFAAAGVGGSGTPLDVGFDLASEGRLEERRILYRGALHANDQETRARLLRYSAGAELLRGLTDAGSELLGAMKGYGFGSASGTSKSSRYTATS